MNNRFELEDKELELMNKIAEMEPNKRKQYYLLESKEIRDPDTYATCCYFFMCGIHDFYLGKFLAGILSIIGAFIFLFSIFVPSTAPVGWVVIAIILIRSTYCLLSSQKIVLKHNLKKMQQILDSVS
jgi:TM2 domain-containing membrane protein YozV